MPFISPITVAVKSGSDSDWENQYIRKIHLTRLIMIVVLIYLQGNRKLIGIVVSDKS